MGSVTALAANTPPAPEASEIITNVLYYLGLSAAVGIGLTLAYLAIPEDRGGIVAARARRVVLPVAVVVAVTAIIQFAGAAASSAGLSWMHGLAPSVLSDFVHSGPGRGSSIGAGTLALIQMGGYVALVATLVGLYLRPGRLLGWLTVVAAVVTASIPFIPFGSSVTVNGAANDILTGVHVLGALLWVGGLVVLCALGVMGRSDRNSLSTDDSLQVTDDWSQIWSRFSLVALWAVGMIIVSGVWMSWTHVGSPVQLFTTAYGRYLGIKLLMVLGLLVAGAYNVRVLLPRIRAARANGDDSSALRLVAHHFPVVVAIESVLAVGVLVVVPFLRGSARQEAGWDDARSFDLAVFGTGVLLVALVAAALWFGSRTPKADASPADRPVSQRV